MSRAYINGNYVDVELMQPETEEQDSITIESLQSQLLNLQEQINSIMEGKQ